MTNGQVTKKILAACKKLRGLELHNKVEALLDTFPLSSHKLVYDRDLESMPTDVKQDVLLACVDSDRRKCQSKNNWLLGMGMKLSASDKSFGRFNG